MLDLIFQRQSLQHDTQAHAAEGSRWAFCLALCCHWALPCHEIAIVGVGRFVLRLVQFFLWQYRKTPQIERNGFFKAGFWSKWLWSVLSICRGMNICTHIHCCRWVHDPYLMWMVLQRWARWCDNSSFGITGKTSSVGIRKQGELSSNSNAARNS
jgi:hypothetical protein